MAHRAPEAAADSRPDQAAALVRVTVASAVRRVDLALPVGLPVVELVPELAGAVGLAGRHSTVPPALSVLTAVGERLDQERSLGAQSVPHGAVLVLAPEVPESGRTGSEPTEAPRDDPAEALGDAVERRVAPWRSAAGHAAALAGCCALLVLSGAGQAALGLSGTGLVAAPVGASSGRGLAGALGAMVAAAGTAGVLALAAALASRGRHRGRARVLAAGSVWHGAVAGGVLGAAAQPSTGAAVLGGGTGVLAAAVVCVAALPGDQLPLLTAAMVGSAVASCGAVLVAAPAAAAPVVAGALVLVSVARLPLPRLALAVARVYCSHDVATTAPAPGSPSSADPARIEAEALLAHRVIAVVTAGLGVLGAVLAPVAVLLGPAGATLASVAGVATLLGARRHRAARLVALDVGAGGAGLVLAAGSALIACPGARAALVGTCLLGALVLAAPRETRRGPGWHATADVVESACVVALLPLLVAAAGLPGRVAGMVGAFVGAGG